MRLVHTCLRFPPATGGAETYVKEIVARTIKIPDRDVRVLTSKMRTHGPISELVPDLLLDDPPYVQRLHHASTPLISYPRLQALKYYLKHHQPDILHSYSFWYQPADVTARYAHQNNIPFIFHPIFYQNNIREKFTWQLYKKCIGHQTFALADVVAVISPFEQKLIEETGFKVKRFELIPPGVDLEKFSRVRLNPFLKRKITGDIILTIGRLSPGKGLEDLITLLPDLIKQQPNLNWVLIGEDFGLRDYLTKQIKQTNLSSRVHFLGKVSEEEKIAALQHATLLVHPSRYEAFGITLAEAQAAGLPVVARDTSAIPFVAPPGLSSLLFNTTQEMRQRIIHLLENQHLRQKLGQAGSKHVAQNFTWDKSIHKILNLYEEFSNK